MNYDFLDDLYKDQELFLSVYDLSETLCYSSKYLKRKIFKIDWIPKYFFLKEHTFYYNNPKIQHRYYNNKKSALKYLQSLHFIDTYSENVHDINIKLGKRNILKLRHYLQILYNQHFFKSSHNKADKAYSLKYDIDKCILYIYDYRTEIDHPIHLFRFDSGTEKLIKHLSLHPNQNILYKDIIHFKGDEAVKYINRKLNDIGLKEPAISVFFKFNNRSKKIIFNPDIYTSQLKNKRLNLLLERLINKPHQKSIR